MGAFSHKFSIAPGGKTMDLIQKISEVQIVRIAQGSVHMSCLYCITLLFVPAKWHCHLWTR